MIPYTTDAPIYHLPIATVGLIVVNTLLYFLFPGHADAVEPYMLATGAGVHPLQWLTHNYIHLSFGHLLGNMLFLWAYGIVVEGKIGWWAFLLLYNAIGLLHGAALQLVMLPTNPERFMAGSSAIIFGLLAVCMIWAPKNELSCLVFWRFVPDVWEIPILWVGVMNIAFEVFDFVRDGGQISSAMGHLSGVVWGAAAGVLMLKRGWVDCENWDLFAVLAGRQGRSVEQDRKLRGPKVKKPSERITGPSKRKSGADQRKQAAPAPTARDDSPTALAQRGNRALEQVEEQLELGEIEAAIAAYDRAARTIPGWPAQPDLNGLIKVATEAEAWDAVTRWLQDAARLYPENGHRARLKLAQVYALRLNRPTKAIRVLEELDPAALGPELARVHQQLLAHARKLQEQGETLEIED